MAWLHLPSSVSSQVRGGACLPRNISLDGGQSAMSSGMSTQSKSSRQGSEMDTLTMPRSGTMLLLSTGDPGLDLWMLSLRAFRASHSAVQARDLPSEILAMGGLPSSASFAKYDPAMRSWRTFQVSYLNHTSDEYLGSWSKRVSILNRIAYRRRRSARRIFAKDYGLLPTPKTARGTYQVGSNGKRSYTLEGMATHNLWPTPTVGSANERKTKYAQGGTSLSLAVKMFGTPGTRGIDNSKHQRVAARKNGTFVTHNGGKLNPTWVEWLMGWPLGWTALEPLETDKFLEWLSKHGVDTEGDERSLITNLQ
jgi:hypothetical protein